MHYITTRIWPILGVIILLLSTNSAISKGLSDDSVFYRATDGREDNVYVVGITRNLMKINPTGLPGSPGAVETANEMK